MARGNDGVLHVYALGEIESQAGPLGGSERVLPAGVRRVPAFPAVGGEGVLWAARNSLEKLGKKEDAVKTYQEMLRNPKLADFSEAAQARQRLQALGGA